MNPRLTIVLPLKGRHPFTLRFLWQANKARVPYRILIADGEVHPGLANLLEQPDKLFPNLDIEYVRYPDDSTFARFYEKMADVAGRVRTPYAMQVDNDDFLAVAGIERSLDFLDAHPDYVCASARIGGFSVYSGIDNPSHGLTGRLNHLGFYYESEDASSSSVMERLWKAGLRLWIYYSVVRTDALVETCRDSATFNFSNLQVHEVFHVMRILTSGKAHADVSAVGYLRQYGTSMQAAFKKDWVHHLLRSRFTSDVDALAERISGIAAIQDDKSLSTVDEEVRTILEGKFRSFIRSNYSPLQAAKQVLRERTPALVGWLKNRPRFFIGRERAALLAELARAGASQNYLARLGDELSMMDDALSGEEFQEFVAPFLPLLAQPGMTPATAPHLQSAN